jgi:hypothetical protein
VIKIVTMTFNQFIVGKRTVVTVADPALLEGELNGLTRLGRSGGGLGG